MQIIGSQVVNLRHNNTISEKFDNLRGGGDSKSEKERNKEKESNNFLEPSEHACLNENKEEKITYRI